MDESKKNKIFFTIIFLLLVVFIFFTYYKFFIKEDFLIVGEVSCDPTIENSCFVFEEVICDDINNESTCKTEINYFKKITKKAYNIPECLGNICGELICLEDGENCEYTYCTEDDEYEEEGYSVSCSK